MIAVLGEDARISRAARATAPRHLHIQQRRVRLLPARELDRLLRVLGDPDEL